MNKSIRPVVQRSIARPALIALALLACTALASAAQGDPTAAHALPGHGHAARAKAGPAKPLVDINSASVKQLKTLPGIGDAEAAKIVEGRPYLTKEDLVTTNILPKGNFVSIKRMIIAKPKLKPNGQPDIPVKKSS